MSPPPILPKEKRGIRRLLEPFGRPHSQPSSQSLSQLDPRMSPAAPPSIDHNAPPDPREQDSIASSNPATVDVIGPTSPTDVTNLNVPSNLGPMHSTPEPINVTPRSALIEKHVDIVPSMGYPAINPLAHDRKSRNVAWGGLWESLRRLKETSRTLPLFPVTINALMTCIDGLEMAQEALQNHQDFEDLATELATVTQSLEQYAGESSLVLNSNSITRVILAIERQTTDIMEELGRNPDRSAQESNRDGEELISHYRRIKDHFQELQKNATLSKWCIENEKLANARLEGLNPSKKASYDSSLSTDVNRRDCTEGTRLGVFDSLERWLCDSSSPPIYWMNGMAGTGKTTIASTFCRRVEQRKLLAASFFCTRNSPECRNVARILPTIASQLAQYSIPFQSALCNILGTNSDIGSRNTRKQFEQLLKEPLQQVRDVIPDNIIVVIDALDECDDRKGVELVLDVLLHYAAQVPLKFLVTSRPEQEIYGKMSAHLQSQEVLHLHDIERSFVQADIELYLRKELESLFPSRADIEQLAQRSGTLFIYAATLVRYISGKRSANPQKRLRSVLDLPPESTKQNTQIDALYAAVLKAALNQGGPDESKVEDIWAVVRTVLLSQEPIGVGTIAELADIDGSHRVAVALQSLRSVLHQSKTGLVSTLHASFPDFMFNKERSGSFFCDVAENNRFLARRCFFIMKRWLRFNICGLESSYLPDEKVKSIQERIDANIPPPLAYACVYWASHLTSASGLDEILPIFEEFLHCRLLFWMEVLSLRREMQVGIDGLLKAQRWLTHSGSPSSEITRFVDDARSFMTSFAVNPASQSTPHIYISSLPLCPQSNLIHKHYHKWTQGLLELKGSLMQRREAAPLAIWTMSSEIQSLALSPDGTRVAIGCLDTTVSILSAYDGTIYVGPLQGHANSISSVVFSHDGNLIASTSLGTFRVWNAHNGTLIAGPFVGHMRHVNSASFSPDDKYVVTGGHDCTIRVWDIYKRALLLGPLTGDDDRGGFVLCVAFSPDGSLIASGSADQAVRLWRSDDGTLATSPFKGHTGRVECLAFTPNGEQLVSGSNDNTIRVWNISDGSTVFSSFEDCVSGIVSLVISTDGTRIVAGSSDRAARVWRIDDGALVAGPFFGHTDTIRSVVCSPDGSRVFSGSSDKTIHVWNVRDGNLPPPRLPPQNAVVAIRSMTFCPDNIHLLSSDVYNVIRRWDTSDGTFTTLPAEGSFFPTPLSMLSPDGSFIASTSKNGQVQIMNTSDGSLVAGPFEVERASLSGFWFSHDSSAIIMGCQDGTIKLYDLRSGNTAVGSIKGHPRGISSLTESPDCSLLVSYSDYEDVFRIWNTFTPALDLKLFNSSNNSATDHRYAAVYDGWNIMENGWVVNNSQHLLFWLPPDIASAWCSPYATLVITKSGTLRVPKQKPLIGDHWTGCYISG